MLELEHKLEEWKAYLKEDGYEEAVYVDTMSVDELKDLLRRASREVKRRVSAYSPNSPEYKSLNEQRNLIEQIQKLLRDMDIEREMEDSGLTLSGMETQSEISLQSEVPDEERREQLSKEIASKQTLYEEARQKGDKETMKNIYKQVEEMAKQYPYCFNVLASFEYNGRGSKRRAVSLYKKACEQGSSVAAYKLALCYYNGILQKKDVIMAKKYLDLAVEREYMPAILLKAFELAEATEYSFYYATDYVEAFSLFKKYYASEPSLDMTNILDRMALYYYYYSGAKSGHNMEENALPVSWERLIEVEGICTDSAKKLPTVMLEGQNEFKQLVRSNLDAGTKEGIRKVIHYFDHEYFTSKPDLRKELDDHLKEMCDAKDTIPEVKAVLCDWYGRRYENGEGFVKDIEMAYAYYGKAGTIKDRLKEFRRNLIRYKNDRDKMEFFTNVMNHGYLDVTKEIAELYERKYQYGKAKDHYQLGFECTKDDEVKKQCEEGFNRCKAKIAAHNAQIEEARGSENQCTTGLGNKLIGFKNLLELAERGNTYAALRYAQIAESDSFLRDKADNFPSDEKIFSLYKAAAYKGEYEAISRMIEIYEKGQLGQEKDVDEAELWRRKL